MRKEYDFSKGKRGPVLASSGKTRITIMLDDEILEFFRDRAESSGSGYQTLINAELRKAVDSMANASAEPLTAERLRQILREELRAA
jgi:uncharacterized protein (DUF4415 family)